MKENLIVRLTNVDEPKLEVCPIQSYTPVSYVKTYTPSEAILDKLIKRYNIKLHILDNCKEYTKRFSKYLNIRTTETLHSSLVYVSKTDDGRYRVVIDTTFSGVSTNGKLMKVKEIAKLITNLNAGESLVDVAFSNDVPLNVRTIVMEDNFSQLEFYTKYGKLYRMINGGENREYIGELTTYNAFINLINDNVDGRHTIVVSPSKRLQELERSSYKGDTLFKHEDGVLVEIDGERKFTLNRGHESVRAEADHIRFPYTMSLGLVNAFYCMRTTLEHHEERYKNTSDVEVMVDDALATLDWSGCDEIDTEILEELFDIDDNLFSFPVSQLKTQVAKCFDKGLVLVSEDEELNTKLKTIGEAYNNYKEALKGIKKSLKLLD